MDKIDMSDKFFHGVKWDSDNLHDKLMTLKEILKSGYILGSASQGIDSPYDDKIFLSVYPISIYSNLYKGNGYAQEDAFNMTRRSFYFILNSKLKDDYKIIPGNYPSECIIQSKIDLYKHLIGIGNAGCEISVSILICYYFNTYMCNEITIDELEKYIRETCWFTNINTAISEIQRSITNPLLDNYFDCSIEKDEKSLIFYRNYYRLKQMMEENNFDINLYDNSGYLVDDVKRLETVKKMKKRIIDSNIPRKDYQDCANELYFKIKHS